MEVERSFSQGNEMEIRQRVIFLNTLEKLLHNFPDKAIRKLIREFFRLDYIPIEVDRDCIWIHSRVNSDGTMQVNLPDDLSDYYWGNDRIYQLQMIYAISQLVARSHALNRNKAIEQSNIHQAHFINALINSQPEFTPNLYMQMVLDQYHPERYLAAYLAAGYLFLGRMLRYST